MKVLELLRKLQQEINEQRRLVQEIESIPAMIKELDEELTGYERGFEKVKNEAKSVLSERVQLEQELDLKKSKQLKLQEQLMSVKDNEQYKATMKEIDFIDKEIGDAEDKILVCMEREDELQQKERDAKQALENKKTSIVEKKEKLSQVRSEKEGKQQKVEAFQNQLRSEIPAEALSLFDRIAEKKDGVGVSAVSDELICAECHFKIRPQVFAELRSSSDLKTCDNCSRILYYVPPETEEE